MWSLLPVIVWTVNSCSSARLTLVGSIEFLQSKVEVPLHILSQLVHIVTPPRGSGGVLYSLFLCTKCGRESFSVHTECVKIIPCTYCLSGSRTSCFWAASKGGRLTQRLEDNGVPVPVPLQFLGDDCLLLL